VAKWSKNRIILTHWSIDLWNPCLNFFKTSR